MNLAKCAALLLLVLSVCAPARELHDIRSLSEPDLMQTYTRLLVDACHRLPQAHVEQVCSSLRKQKAAESTHSTLVPALPALALPNDIQIDDQRRKRQQRQPIRIRPLVKSIVCY